MDDDFIGWIDTEEIPEEQGTRLFWNRSSLPGVIPTCRLPGNRRSGMPDAGKRA